MTTSSASLQHPTLHIELSPENSDRLINLCGPFNTHLTQIETELEVIIKNRGYQFNLSGEQEKIKKTAHLLSDLYSSTATESLTANTVHLFIQQSKLTIVVDPPPKFHLIPKYKQKENLLKGVVITKISIFIIYIIMTLLLV